MKLLTIYKLSLVLTVATVVLTSTPAGAQQAPSVQAAQPQQVLPQQIQAPVTLPLRLVATPEFCSRLQSTFTQYAVQRGYNRVQTTLLASGATSTVVDEFRQGRASDYISTVSLARYARQTEGIQQGYLPMAQFVGQAMGISGNIVLALSSGELRFIPHAQRGMNIVVVAQNGAALTPERAQKVAEIAHNLDIRIHVIWVGATDPAQTERLVEARSLAWLAAVTGGGFANLGGNANPCAQVM